MLPHRHIQVDPEVGEASDQAGKEEPDEGELEIERLSLLKYAHCSIEGLGTEQLIPVPEDERERHLVVPNWQLRMEAEGVAQCDLVSCRDNRSVRCGCQIVDEEGHRRVPNSSGYGRHVDNRIGFTPNANHRLHLLVWH